LKTFKQFCEGKCQDCGAEKKNDLGMCGKCGRFPERKAVDIVCSKCGKPADRGPGELKCICGNKTFNKKYE
jgi:hypothetical protein